MNPLYLYLFLEKIINWVNSTTFIYFGAINKILILFGGRRGTKKSTSKKTLWLKSHSNAIDLHAPNYGKNIVNIPQILMTRLLLTLTRQLVFDFKAGFICKGSPLQVAACANCCAKLGRDSYCTLRLLAWTASRYGQTWVGASYIAFLFGEIFSISGMMKIKR